VNRVLIAAFSLMLIVAARADFRFIHASDTHCTSPDNQRVDAAQFKEIAGLNPQPKFVVVTGDIVDTGTDAEYARFGEIAKNVDPVKLMLAPGNHDVRWNPRGKEGYTRGTGGKLYQSWDYENVHFVTLDSTVLLEHWGHISQEQLDWLKKDLEKVGTEKPVILGFHHPIGGEYTMVDNQQQLLDLVDPYNVVLWLQGHGHADVDWNVNGVPAKMVAGLYQGSYDIIDVSADELKITKRFIPKKERKELLQNSSQPEDEPTGQTRPLMTILLKKQVKPQIVLSPTKPPGFAAKITPSQEKGAVVECSWDGQPYAAMESVNGAWVGKYSPSGVLGHHRAIVRLKLPDGKAFTKPWDESDCTAAWETNIGGAVQSRLLLGGDTLFVTSMGNDLVALNPVDGKEKFRTPTEGPIFSSPEISDGVVYFGSADHSVYAVDASNGKVRWKHPTNGAVLAGPAVAKGVVCIGSTDKNIYGLSIKDGSVMWTVKGQNMFQSKTATDGERFFVGGWDNHFRCIDAKSGEVKWDLPLGRPQTMLKGFSAFAPAITHPCVGNGKVFVSTNDGTFHAINIVDGKEAWKNSQKNMGYSSPCFHDGKVFFALTDGGTTWCANADTGEILWQRDVGSVIYDGGFCFGGGNVFIGCVSGVFNAIDATTGKIAWQYRLAPGHLLATGAADNNKVYISSMNGIVTALPVNLRE
jgi:outer membrane protein assembly factor BamB